MEWRAGHKTNCGEKNAQNFQNPFIFDEFELVCEEIADESDEDDEAEPDKEETDKAQQTKQSLKDVEAKELEDEEESIVKELDDEYFQKWRRTLDKEQAQVLRYNRDGGFILPGPPEDLNFGKCDSCGEERSFEFQLTPHLFTYFECSMHDWATVLVATCRRDCQPNDGFVKEFSKEIIYAR